VFDSNRVTTVTHLPLKNGAMASGLSRNDIVMNVAIDDDIPSVVVCDITSLVDDALRRV